VSSRDPVRVAIVGAGRMGRTHLAALAGSSEVNVAAVVEPVERVRDEVAAGGIGAYATLDALLAAGDVEAVLIAAPTDLHAELVAQVAAAGLPILCEKPCGLRPDETAEAIRAAADADVVLQIGYWRRFVPELGARRQQLVEGALGELSTISCWQWDAHPPAPSFRVRSGGILLDMGVHEFDQIRWLTGQEIEDVQALPAAATWDAAIVGDPESIVALARLSDGAVATVSLGRRFPHGDCCWLELMGTDGYERKLFMWGEDGVHVFHEALVAQADAFAAAVRGEPQRGATGEDALRAIEAADRAAQSVAAGARG
jgi:myo-inositol 2-dehydrogenase / D-chiro-inositol 1-dehydrogenase